MDRGTMGRCRFHRGHKMKWLGRLMASAAALLAAGSVSAAVGETRSAADAAWTEAVKSDTLAAYAAFAMTFPDSEHAAAAHRELSGQQWAALREAAAGRSLLGYGGERLESTTTLWAGILGEIKASGAARSIDRSGAP